MLTCQLVCSDIDGTLIGPAGLPTARTCHAIRNIYRAGATFCLMTGRMPLGCSPVAQTLGIPLWTICLGGSLVMSETHAIVMSQTLDAVSTHRLISMFDHEFPEVMPSYFVQTHWYVQDPLHPEIRHEAAVVHAEPEQAPLHDLLASEALPNKLFISCSHNPSEGFALEARIRQLCPNLSVIRSASGSMVEILPSGVTKLTGFLHVANQLQIPASQVVAFGNDLNDLPVLQRVGCPVAVANACPEVLNLCREHTLSCSDDGVAHWLESSGFFDGSSTTGQVFQNDAPSVPDDCS